MAPHSSTLAWKIPWTEEPGRLQSMGRTESDTTERLHFHFSLSRIGEGNGNPLQCSCLENPRDGGAWSMGPHRVGHDWSDLAAVAATVTNRVKRLDLIECLKNYGQRLVTLYRRQWSRPSPRKMQKGKMGVWGGLTNSWEKKRSQKPRRKGKIYPYECRVPKKSKERWGSLPQWSLQRNRGKQ